MNYKIAPTYYARLRGVLDYVPHGGVLLNAGCGTGEFNYYLRDRFDSSYGIDINAQDIQTANELNTDPAIRFSQGNIEQLDFDDNYFDAIICIEVLEHVSQPDQVLRELQRVLKPTGKLIITVPHHRYPFFYDPINFVSERLLNRHFPIGIWGFGHTKLFEKDQLRALLEKAGFAVETTELLTHTFCGLLEGYIPTVLQPLFKSNSNNESSVKKGTRKEKLWHFSYDIPSLFSRILNVLVRFDRALGKNSNYGVGVLMVAEKRGSA